MMITATMSLRKKDKRNNKNQGKQSVNPQLGFAVLIRRNNYKK